MSRCFNFPDTAVVSISSDCAIKITSSKGTVEYFDKILKYSENSIDFAKNGSTDTLRISQIQLSVDISTLAAQLETDMMACVQLQNRPPILQATTVGATPVFSIDTTGISPSRIFLFHNSTKIPQNMYSRSGTNPTSFNNIQGTVGTATSIWEIHVF